MSTTYYCVCLNCRSLIDLGNFSMVPSEDEYFDIEDDIESYANDASNNRTVIRLLLFLQRHQGHKLVLGNSDCIDNFADDWYSTYKREMKIHG